jgi:hypothetical protein
LQLFSEPAFYTSLLIGKISKRDDHVFQAVSGEAKQNRPQWANFRVVCTVGYYLDFKEKIRRIGGCKGRSPRVYLTDTEVIKLVVIHFSVSKPLWSLAFFISLTFFKLA